MDDTQAMNAIHGALNGDEWNAETLDIIAEFVTLTGRKILEPDDMEDDED